MRKALNKPRVLIYDIETVNLKADISPILCLGYKWLGTPKTEILKSWDYDCFKGPTATIDRDLLIAFLSVLQDADAVLGHYSDRFDNRFVNSRCLIHGLPPIPHTIRRLDTWKLAKYNTAFCSNRMKTLAEALNCTEQKADSGGFFTFLDALRGCPKAQKNLIYYCKQDVKTTEALYEKLSSLAPAPISMAVITGQPVCPHCGADTLTGNGRRVMVSGVWQRYRCKSCGKNSSSPVAEDGSALKPR
jgi:uncharacterized protein YprB with RNaseH-like and TPR domain